MVRIVKLRCRLTDEQATEAVNELFGKVGRGGKIVKPGLLAEAVARGHEVDILGFGRFERRERKARQHLKRVGSKGSEGGKVQIQKRHVVYFVTDPQFQRYVRRPERYLQ